MLVLSSSTVTAMAPINKCAKISTTSKNMLGEPESLCYRQRFGNIHYAKSGGGKLLLLIHDLSAAPSGYEWNQVVSFLSKKYTIYMMDLLGCGRLEKPCLTYTNYLYVQLIADSVKSEIGHRTDVISTGHSSALAIVAYNNNPELFNKLLLISPDSILTCSRIPGKYAELYRRFLDFLIIGILPYHIATGKQAIRESFIAQYPYNPYSIRESYVNPYYEVAHLNLLPKSIYASVHCNYTKANITNAIKKIDNSIYIIGGAGTDNIKGLLNKYTIYNPAIEYTLLPDTEYLPQLEKSTEFISTVKAFLS